MATGETAKLIPDGTEVTARLVGCERVRYDGNVPAYMYKMVFAVLSGPHAGATAVRRLWHNGKGWRQLTDEMAKLGHVHAEEICGLLRREYLVAAGIRVEKAKTGGLENTVAWFEPLPTGGQHSPPETTTASAAF